MTEMNRDDCGGKRFTSTGKCIDRDGVTDAIRSHLFEHVQPGDEDAGSYLEAGSHRFIAPKHAPEVAGNALVRVPWSREHSRRRRLSHYQC